MKSAIRHRSLEKRKQKRSNLINHAEKELKTLGLFDKGSSYDGELAESVMELIKVNKKV